MDSRFLIIARVSDHSQHSHWLQGETPKFDVFINYAGDTPAQFDNDGTFYEHSKGEKWPALAALLDTYWELISTYDAVWFPSDHLQSNSTNINRLFHLFDGHQLALAEPAIVCASPTPQSKSTSLMRFVNQISAVAPFFSRQNLAQLKPSFAHKQHTHQPAIDWCLQTPNTARNQIAIIDAAAVIDSSGDSARDNRTSLATEVYGQYIFQPPHA